MLKGKVAIITGSTSGIGLSIARALAQEGSHIVINGFGDPHEIEELRGSLAKEFGVHVDYDGADMSKPQEIKAMINNAEARRGSVDILVNNAGIQFVAPIEEFPDDKWESIISINLSASFYTIKGALPGMRKRNWGRIINIASAHGLVASPAKAAYVSAKHGLVGLTKVVALESATQNITCNAICPGWVLTPLVQKQIEARAAKEGVSVEQATLELVSEKQPSRRFASSEQIAAFALFLTSEAAGAITGSALSIDGGWTAL